MTTAKAYIEASFEAVKARNPHETEFLQAVEELFNTLEPVSEAHPEYITENILARIVEPERIISFRGRQKDPAKKAPDQYLLF